MNLTDDATDRYTLLVTSDGVLVAAYFSDPGSSGASHGLGPESRHSPWVRNMTDGVDGAGDGDTDRNGGDPGENGGATDGSGSSGEGTDGSVPGNDG